MTSFDAATLAQHLRPAAFPARPLKIFYWSASEVDGTWTYRVKMPGEELRRLGHDIQMGTRIGAWARDEADIIVGQRVCLPAPSTLWQLICEGRRRSGRGGTVYEVDDDLFNIDAATNPLARQFLQPAVRRNMIANIRAAHACTVSTETLAGVLRNIRGRVGGVHVVPNAIRAEVLTTPVRPHSGPVILGWQGSSTHAEDWLECRPAVAQVLESDASVHVRFLGVAHPEGLDVAIRRGQADALPWTADIAQHYKRVARFSVSLAPLKDTIFNRSKSGLRVQESLALGVPVVASDVVAYRPWVVPGVTGFLAADANDWLTALARLSSDPQLRADMGAAGRAAAHTWTIEATAPRWLDVYRSLLPEA